MKLLACIVALVCVTTAVSGAGYSGPTNQAGLNLIKEFEGWFPNFYTDPVGIKTIGYGHACHVWDCSVPLNGKYAVPLSSANGQQLLLDDLSYPGRYEGCVNAQVTYNLNANQFSALASFVFNLGCGNFGSSTLKTLLNQGNIYGASEEFGKWVYGGGVILPGLVRRREAERVLFCTGGACGTGGTKCRGTVKADGGLNIRSAPNTGATIVGSLANGATTDIGGRTTGTVVGGNSYWFSVGGGYASASFFTISQSSGDAWCSVN